MVKSVLYLVLALALLPVRPAGAALSDCNHPRLILQKVICSDDGLREQNNRLKEQLNLPEIRDNEWVKLYRIYFESRLIGCENEQCLREQYDRFATWLSEKRYLAEKEEISKTKCRLNNITDDCEIYAYSNYTGARKINGLYISKRAETYGTPVRINRPGKCVVLLLSAYKPTIWDIYTAPGTDLRAIAVGGYYEQMLRGMPASVQTKRRINYRGPEEDRCIDTYYDEREMPEVAAELNLGNGKVHWLKDPVIGEILSLDQYDYKPKIIDGDFLQPALAPGADGLKQLVKEKKLLPLRAGDLQKIRKMKLSVIGGVMPDGFRGNIMPGLSNFLVLQSFAELPENLAGANSINVFVPKGLMPPDASSGHSRVYQLPMEAEEVKAVLALPE